MSYMDRKNIISEGFFDRLMKLFKQDRKVMKDPSVKKAKQDFDDAIKQLEKALSEY